MLKMKCNHKINGHRLFCFCQRHRPKNLSYLIYIFGFGRGTENNSQQTNVWCLILIIYMRCRPLFNLLLYWLGNICMAICEMLSANFNDWRRKKRKTTPIVRRSHRGTSQKWLSYSVRSEYTWIHAPLATTPYSYSTSAQEDWRCLRIGSINC